jgi:vancomycin resistance protein VanW
MTELDLTLLVAIKHMRTKQRSKIRLLAGRLFYTITKQIYWHCLNIDFANQADDILPYVVFEHKTPLVRRLAGVDLNLQKNKIVNLRLATEKINGLLIEPGQIFSYWREIDKPTKAKGYLEGMVLQNGKITTGIGGGLCQLSNLIYWMSLHTPLTVIERWRHGYDVFPDANRAQPFGSGATCAYPYIDLQIINQTKQKFQLMLEMTDEYLIGRWLSDKPVDYDYEIFEKEHAIKQELFGTYSRNNKIFRKIIDKKTGKIMGEEFVAENHALMMYNPLLK